MFGEGTAQVGSPRIEWHWIDAHPIPTALGLLQDPKSANTYRRFNSRHTGIVQFAMGDGSVRGLRPGGTVNWNPASSDWWVLQRMAGMADSETYDLSVLSN